MEWKVMEGPAPANSGSARPSDIINESGVQSGYTTCLFMEHAAMQEDRARYCIPFVWPPITLLIQSNPISLTCIKQSYVRAKHSNS